MWRYRLVDLADSVSDVQYHTDMVNFWNGLDAIGIDIYRSLASDEDTIPDDYDELVSQLQLKLPIDLLHKSTIHLLDIEFAVGNTRPAILKEVGFRSVEKGFVRPFEYSGSDDAPYNEDHQAAAIEATLRSFNSFSADWFRGAVFWDASVSLAYTDLETEDLSSHWQGKEFTSNTRLLFKVYNWDCFT